METPPNPQAAPLELRLLGDRKMLRVSFGDGETFELGAEFLRVNSPSAEVRGHGGSGGVVPTGKADVRVKDIQPVGQYAARLVFDDGHDSGIYSWAYLRELGRNRRQYWERYLRRSAALEDGDASA
ncbi:gamma-butyrobetaine hydroxylase-like domain-containing protein [Candidatus Foliamicus sp.]